jgi:hypothetical protein
MQCNIDAKGKVVRLVGGILAIAAAALVGLLLLLDVVAGWPWWAGAGGLACFGGFGIFEARAGWCAVRAMGIKTPL